MEGVVATLVGYSGGDAPAPTYHSIGDHTEAVLVAYDRTKITYGELLKVFWASHDPRQAGYSRQYRNAVFAMDPEQKAQALESLAEVERRSGGVVRTSVLDAKIFFPAEDYHQKYYLKQRPDLAGKVRELHPDETDFVSSTLAARLNGALGGNGSKGDVDGILKANLTQSPKP